MGPGWFLPATTLGFGVCSIATAFVTTRAQACAVRFLLGIFEAGVMPGGAYFLSRWYRRAELTFRLGLWMVMGKLQICILAYGADDNSPFVWCLRWAISIGYLEAVSHRFSTQLANVYIIHAVVLGFTDNE